MGFIFATLSRPFLVRYPLDGSLRLSAVCVVIVIVLVMEQEYLIRVNHI